jgi:magnesium-transporting ATPase (P-type)
MIIVYLGKSTLFCPKSVRFMSKSKHKHISNKDMIWHATDPEIIIGKLGSSVDGLSNNEVAKLLHRYGPNLLPSRKIPPIWKIILHQILNPLIFILIAALFASLLIGEVADVIFIFVVILLNTAIGTYQEYQAEQSAASLQKMVKGSAKVIREGSTKNIGSDGLVPGDIVLLETGDKIPADIRLFEARSLAVDESLLTGESVAIQKDLLVLDENTIVAERRNMAYAGSTVMSGRAKGIVVTTGMQTQIGLIAKDVAQSESAAPPLVQRMEKFTRQIGLLVIVLSVLIGLVLRNQGMDMMGIFFFVVALTVSAIPEGLPVSLTVVLSIASKKMSTRNVIVRQLNAVESLGSCTVIASDKTGTLTVNQQTAKRILLPNGFEVHVTGEGYNGEGVLKNMTQKELNADETEAIRPLLRSAILANEGHLFKGEQQWQYRGDAMDVALLGLAIKAGKDPESFKREYRPENEIPYESELKFSASFYSKADTLFISAKGAVETILEFCNHMYVDGQELPIDRVKIEAQTKDLARQGYRVLAFAGARCPHVKKDGQYSMNDLCKLNFYGLVGFIDPLRPEAIEAVTTCKQAGIKVIMITGDHPTTSKAIADELQLADQPEEVVTGAMLEQAGNPDSPAFETLVLATHVFARVSPAQKLEIVDVLIRKGEFVAVTGDGVNDTPALRRANIGVAMGSGTDAAREVGSMIVVDDNFASIVAGVEEGRFAYANVRKVIYLLISTGAAEVGLFLLSILAGIVMGIEWGLPLLAPQILWLNLVTNGIQDKALAFEGGEKGVMQLPPRKTTEKIFDSLMIQHLALAGFTMAIISFGVWLYLTQQAGVQEHEARNFVLLLLVLMQNFQVFNARSETVSAFKIPIQRNYFVLGAVILAQGTHIAAMHLPFMQQLLQVAPVSIKTWGLCLTMALFLLIVVEIFKLLIKEKRYSALPGYAKVHD